MSGTNQESIVTEVGADGTDQTSIVKEVGIGGNVVG